MSDDSKILTTRIQQLYCTEGDSTYNILKNSFTPLKKGETCTVVNPINGDMYLVCGDGSTTIDILPRWYASKVAVGPSNIDLGINPFTYNGEEQSISRDKLPVFEYAEIDENKSNFSGKDAGEYQVWYTLKEPHIVTWGDGTTQDKYGTWRIEKKTITCEVINSAFIRSSQNESEFTLRFDGFFVDNDEVEIHLINNRGGHRSFELSETNFSRQINSSEILIESKLSRSDTYTETCNTYKKGDSIDFISGQTFGYVQVNLNSDNYKLRTSPSVPHTTVKICSAVHPVFNDCSMQLIEKLATSGIPVFFAGQTKTVKAANSVYSIGIGSDTDKPYEHIKKDDDILITVAENQTSDSLKLFLNKYTEGKKFAFYGCSKFVNSYVDTVYERYSNQTFSNDDTIYLNGAVSDASPDDFLIQLRLGFYEGELVNKKPSALTNAIGFSNNVKTYPSSLENGVLYDVGDNECSYVLDKIDVRVNPKGSNNFFEVYACTVDSKGVLTTALVGSVSGSFQDSYTISDVDDLHQNYKKLNADALQVMMEIKKA